MFSPGNIIHAFFLNTSPPKSKYLISLFRNDSMYVVACFTTSQERAGVPLDEIKHGKITDKAGNVLSYVFLCTKDIGIIPNVGIPFRFPKNTVVRFDYCFQQQNQSAFLKLMKAPCVVGKLSEKEYEGLIYAMYKSNDTPEEYKQYFEDILFRLGK